DHPSAGRDDLHSGNTFRWFGEMARVSEFSPEIQSAAVGEDFSEAGGSDLHLPCQLEGSPRAYQHGRSLSAGMRGRKKKYPFHGFTKEVIDYCIRISRNTETVRVPFSWFPPIFKDPRKPERQKIRETCYSGKSD